MSEALMDVTDVSLNRLKAANAVVQILNLLRAGIRKITQNLTTASLSLSLSLNAYDIKVRGRVLSSWKKNHCSDDFADTAELVV